MMKDNVLPFYTVLFCGGIAFLLAFLALVQEDELQAIFLMVFVVLCTQIAIYFKIGDLLEAMRQSKND